MTRADEQQRLAKKPLLAMPKSLGWNHNDYYHPLLLRQIPDGATRALDVGCGTGRFARQLAQRVAQVDAIDRSAEALALARERSAGIDNIRFVDADLFDFEVDASGYDFISLIAVIHHMDFDAAAARLRTMLKPGGVLAILGATRDRSLTDYARSVLVMGVNVGFGAIYAVRRAVGWDAGFPTGPAGAVQAPVRDPEMSYRDVAERAAVSLPGSVLKRHFFWRYSLVCRREA